MSRHWIIWSTIGGLLLAQNVSAAENPRFSSTGVTQVADWRHLLELLRAGREKDIENLLNSMSADQRAETFWDAWRREHSDPGAASKPGLSDYLVERGKVTYGMVAHRDPDGRPIATWLAHDHPAHFDPAYFDALLARYGRYDDALNNARFAYAIDRFSVAQDDAIADALVAKYHPRADDVKNMDTSKMTDNVRAIHKSVLAKVSRTPGQAMKHAERGAPK